MLPNYHSLAGASWHNKQCVALSRANGIGNLKFCSHVRLCSHGVPVSGVACRSIWDSMTTDERIAVEALYTLGRKHTNPFFSEDSMRRLIKPAIKARGGEAVAKTALDWAAFLDSLVGEWPDVDCWGPGWLQVVQLDPDSVALKVSALQRQGYNGPVLRKVLTSHMGARYLTVTEPEASAARAAFLARGGNPGPAGYHAVTLVDELEVLSMLNKDPRLLDQPFSAVDVKATYLCTEFKGRSLKKMAYILRHDLDRIGPRASYTDELEDDYTTKAGQPRWLHNEAWASAKDDWK
eukprot:gene11659-34369_t